MRLELHILDFSNDSPCLVPSTTLYIKDLILLSGQDVKPFAEVVIPFTPRTLNSLQETPPVMAEVELDESGEPQARQLDQVSASILDCFLSFQL